MWPTFHIFVVTRKKKLYLFLVLLKGILQDLTRSALNFEKKKDFYMIVIHIGILIYPVKDAAKSGSVFLKNIGFLNSYGIPKKLKRSITIDTLLFKFGILRCIIARTVCRLSLSLHNVLYRHLWHFLKRAKLDIWPKSVVFNHFSVYFQHYKCLFISPKAFTITSRQI